METLTMLLDALFALGGVAAFGFGPRQYTGTAARQCLRAAGQPREAACSDVFHVC
jgi:hypothetical protein